MAGAKRPEGARVKQRHDLRDLPPDGVRPSPAWWLPRPRRWGRRLAVAAVLLAFLALALWLVDLRLSLRNPFAERAVDRSPPVLLKAIEDLSVYKAATGHFQILVDLETDAPFLPSAIKGERTLFQATGSVDAEVDFSTVGSEAIEVSQDGRAATITLPRPRLGPARLDTARSRVVSRDRGLLDRLGSVLSDNPGSERELYLLAEQKVAAAATQSDLVARAEQNTRTMLQGMLRSLGYTSVTVVFTDRPAAH
jgi:hypothetical protein